MFFRAVGTNIAVTAAKQSERKYEADLYYGWQAQKVPAD
jgi:hypothetical protein